MSPKPFKLFNSEVVNLIWGILTNCDMLFPGTNLNKAKLRIWVVVEHDWNEKKNEWKDLPSENNLHLGALFLEYQYWFQKFMYSKYYFTFHWLHSIEKRPRRFISQVPIVFRLKYQLLISKISWILKLVSVIFCKW